MNSFHIRMLSPADASALLAFELENRSWFESQIEARSTDFYSDEGVIQHIAELLDGYKTGLCYPAVILDSSGQIIGRANLKNVVHEELSAELGYRIAGRYTNQGLGSAALTHLMAMAEVEWGLKKLTAYVTEDNYASAHLLKKAGFTADKFVADLAQIQGRNCSGYRYTLQSPCCHSQQT